MSESSDSPSPRISKSLRYEVMRRDNHTCRYCGASAPDVKMTIDHVMPVTLGGTNDPGNLVAACTDCNAGKKATPPGAPLVADVQQSQLRWQAARTAAARAMSVKIRERDTYAQTFLAEWESYSWGDKGQYISPLPDNWRTSVDTLHDYSLPVEIMVQCVRIACSAWGIPAKRSFRYFMGCCNKRLAELDDMARAMLESEDWS